MSTNSRYIQLNRIDMTIVMICKEISVYRQIMTYKVSNRVRDGKPFEKCVGKRFCAKVRLVDQTFKHYHKLHSTYLVTFNNYSNF